MIKFSFEKFEKQACLWNEQAEQVRMIDRLAFRLKIFNTLIIRGDFSQRGNHPSRFFINPSTTIRLIKSIMPKLDHNYTYFKNYQKIFTANFFVFLPKYSVVWIIDRSPFDYLLAPELIPGFRATIWEENGFIYDECRTLVFYSWAGG